MKGTQTTKALERLYRSATWCDTAIARSRETLEAMDMLLERVVRA